MWQYTLLMHLIKTLQSIPALKQVNIFIYQPIHSVMEGKKKQEALVMKVQWSWLFYFSSYLKEIISHVYC